MVDELSIICKAMPEFTKEQIKEIIDKAQATEENKKTWDSLDIIKKIEVIRHTLKPKPQFEPPEEVSPSKKKSVGSANMDNQSNKGLIYAVVIGIVAVVVSIMFVSSQFVSKADFTKNIQGMNAVVDKAVNNVNQTKDMLTSKIAEIPGMITTQTSGLSNQVLQSNQQINNISTDLNNKINGIQTTLTQNVAELKKSNEVLSTSVSSQIKTISDNVTSNENALKSQIASLQEQLNKLQTQVTNTQTLSNLIVSGTSTNISFPIPSLIITNSNTSSVDTTNVAVTLTMTPPSGITITSPNYSITGSGGLISTTLSLKTTLGSLGISSVAPGTITIPAPNITLVATPQITSTNVTWLAIWSKN